MIVYVCSAAASATNGAGIPGRRGCRPRDPLTGRACRPDPGRAKPRGFGTPHLVEAPALPASGDGVGNGPAPAGGEDWSAVACARMGCLLPTQSCQSRSPRERPL